MKSITLTGLGKFPFTQTKMDYLQTAWTEALQALAAALGNTSEPFVISGCVVSVANVAGTLFAYTITAGWVYYQGALIRVPGNEFTLDTSINGAYILISPTSTAVTYENGSIDNAINDVTGAIGAQPIGTANSASMFLLAGLEAGLQAALATIGANVTALQTNVNTLIEEYGILNAEVASNTAEIETNTSNITALTTQGNNNAANITTLQGQVATGAWIAIPISAGWAQSALAPAYRLDGMDKIVLRGAIVCTTAGASRTAVTIPAGSTPAVTQNFPVAVCISGTYGTNQVQIVAGGGITIYANAGLGDLWSLDGIVYYIN